MNPENKQPSFSSVPEHTERSEFDLPDIATMQQEMGKRVLFRVMNLDYHSGVTQHDGEGHYVYTIDNQAYPTQGDFAFGSAGGFDAAVTRAYPNYLGNVHAVRADEADIVEPYPDEAPGLVFIKNGATVEAKKVPLEMVDQHIALSNAEKDDPESTRRVIQQLFPQ